MPSTFSGLYICLRAMQAQQLSLETYAHNIANAETDGFSRQRAVLETTPPWPMPSINSSGMVGQVGTGVDVARIERLRDAYLDVQIRKEKGILGEWTIKQDTLEQIEIIFQEPTETGLNSLLTQFWDSWLQLSMNPEGTSSAVRTTVVETAASLCDALRHTKMQLDALSEDMDNIIEIKVNQVNSIAKQIDALNNQIKTLKTAGFEPNDLMDQRDLLLDELAGVIDFKFKENTDGTINVNLYDPASGSYDRTLVDGISENVPVTVTDVQNAATSGELKGLFDSKEMVNEYRADLETFAANLITEVNAQHEKGYDLYGYTNRRFFIGTGADDIVVNPAIKENVFRIAAASTQDGGPGDGSNALAISRLRETGFDDSYRNLISRLGVDTNESRRMKENQEALVGQLGKRKESISGVSIDEELAHMIECQHSYQAAARFLNTMDQLLDTLINRTAM